MTVNECKDCGMILSGPFEYHPFAACLMFKACRNDETVRANLNAVVDYGRAGGKRTAKNRGVK